MKVYKSYKEQRNEILKLKEEIRFLKLINKRSKKMKLKIFEEFVILFMKDKED
jgi:hypothetical protein